MIARNYRQIKNIGKKGADANEVDSAQTLVRALSTKIKVAIQVIDRTSITISKLRDEEMWPLMSELIQKYVLFTFIQQKLILQNLLFAACLFHSWRYVAPYSQIMAPFYHIYTLLFFHFYRWVPFMK